MRSGIGLFRKDLMVICNARRRRAIYCSRDKVDCSRKFKMSSSCSLALAYKMHFMITILSPASRRRYKFLSFPIIKAPSAILVS